MKKTISLFFIFSFHLINAQTVDCLPLQKGTFKMASEGIGDTYITRTKKHQIEETPKIGLKTSYDIVWVNACTYELRNRTILEGKPLMNIGPDSYVIVEITKVNLKSYVVKVSSNFSDKTFDGVVEIIK